MMYISEAARRLALVREILISWPSALLSSGPCFGSGWTSTWSPSFFLYADNKGPHVPLKLGIADLSTHFVPLAAFGHVAWACQFPCMVGFV